MKKAAVLLIAVSIMLALLSGCADQGGKAPAPPPQPPAGDSSIPPAEESVPSPSGEPAELEKLPESGDRGAEVDVDLTALSSTMVYGEVFQMMIDPEVYIGKTIKMRGLYYASLYEPTEQYCHFVIISDATACCAQGLEFIWTGEHIYPDDYPPDDTEIEITGVWESYEEEGQTWYRIRTDAVGIV